MSVTADCSDFARTGSLLTPTSLFIPFGGFADSFGSWFSAPFLDDWAVNSLGLEFAGTLFIS